MKVTGSPTVELSLTIELTEEEARALDALFGYDGKAFLRVFYKEMGEAYLKPHEAGLHSLHKTTRDCLSIWLSRANTARKAFYPESKL